MSDSYAPPTSPAYLPTHELELPRETYIPTLPEDHPPSYDHKTHPDSELDSDRSAASHRDSNREARSHREPDQGANVPDSNSNHGANDISSKSTAFSTPTDQPVVARPNVGQVIRGRRSAASPGYRRLTTTGVTPSSIQRRLERVKTVFCLVYTRLRSLENREVVTDPHTPNSCAYSLSMIHVEVPSAGHYT